MLNIIGGELKRLAHVSKPNIFEEISMMDELDDKTRAVY